MTTATLEHPLADVYDDAFAPACPTPLVSHVGSAPADAWLWCFRCERAFQAGDAPDGHCAYADCEGQPLDIWQWDAYRAFVRSNVVAPQPHASYYLHDVA